MFNPLRYLAEQLAVLYVRQIIVSINLTCYLWRNIRPETEDMEGTVNKHDGSVDLHRWKWKCTKFCFGWQLRLSFKGLSFTSALFSSQTKSTVINSCVNSPLSLTDGETC